MCDDCMIVNEKPVEDRNAGRLAGTARRGLGVVQPVKREYGNVNKTIMGAERTPYMTWQFSQVV